VQIVQPHSCAVIPPRSAKAYNSDV